MTATATEPTGAPSRGLGYQFDPIPSALKADRRLGHLTDRDLVVASEMIAIGRWGGHDSSCWTTKAVIGQRLGIAERTVQASWSRLKARGWIVERHTGPVDPEDPRNRTGRRFWWGWLVQAEGRPTVEGGEQESAPGGEQKSALKIRNTQSSENTTDRPVVVEIIHAIEEGAGASTETIRGPSTISHDPRGSTTGLDAGRDVGPLVQDPPHHAPPYPPPPHCPPAVIPHPPQGHTNITLLPAPLAEVIASLAIGEPLRRQLGRVLPRWLATHPVERVAAALRAMVEAARHRRVRSPIGFLVGTLRNMAAEGDHPSELAPAPPPTRTPSPDATAARLAEIRRGESDAADRRQRWAALVEADRRRIEAEVEAECPRPVGMPERFWRLSCHAACLDRMEEDKRPEALPASRTGRTTSSRA